MKQECDQLKTKKLDASNEEWMDIKRSIDEIKKMQNDTVPWNLRGTQKEVLLFN